MSSSSNVMIGYRFNLAKRQNTMRLFFALWPDDSTQQQWAYTISPLLNMLGGQPSAVSNLHLTLHFLGEVDGSQVTKLSHLGADVAGHAPSLHFDRIECWKNADVACLRPKNEPMELSQLVGNLATGLELAGFAIEKRKFKAHVTVARTLKHHEAALPLWPPITWQAETLALVRSRLTPNGPIYAPIAQWPLTTLREDEE